MRKLILIAALLVAPLAAGAAEVLVSNAVATRMDPSPSKYRVGIEIQNNGPNSIACQLKNATGLTATKGRIVFAGDAWAVAAPAQIGVWCIAATAAQVTGAATNVAEVP